MRRNLFKVKGGFKIKFLLTCKQGFTCHHKREVKSLLDGLAVHLVWQSCKTHVFLVLVLKSAHRGEIIHQRSVHCHVSMTVISHCKNLVVLFKEF